jgi:hypothetical protein
MKALKLAALLSMTTGCGLHLHRRAPVASPEVAQTIQFPEWRKESSTTVQGPQLRALQIALDDFMPPGRKPPGDADPLTRCLFQLVTYDAWVERGDRVTFIHFTPLEDERCGLKPEAMDPGASYAISDDGVILKRE